MKKVLFVSSWYPTPASPSLGIFVKEHARAIKTAGGDIRVLAVVVLRDEPYCRITHRDYVDDFGIKTYELVIHSRLRDLFHHLVPLQQFLAYRYYKKKIRRTFQPDLIHSNVVFPAGMLGRYIARKSNVPYIVTEHWSKLGTFLAKPVLGKMAQKVYQDSSRILPVSFFQMKHMESLLPEINTVDKFRIIPNVISSDIFKYAPKSSGGDVLRFCSVATWSRKRQPDKYPEIFIQALARLQLQIAKPIELTVVGGGNQVPELQQLCERLKLRAVFTGPQTKHQIAAILQQSDFFLHSSRIETFGVVVVEALMTGTPVVCSQVGALPELINDSNGILCTNEVDNWVAGIQKVLRMSFDGIQISEDVKGRYSYETIGHQILTVYDKI